MNPTALTPEEQAIYEAMEFWTVITRSERTAVRTIIRRLDARVRELACPAHATVKKAGAGRKEVNLVLRYYFVNGYFYVGNGPWPHHWINGDLWHYAR